jgi:very-short-patch-repair endonuclease
MGIANRESRGQAGSTGEKLEWSRQQLLDLTARNKLLNFPPGAPDFKDRDNRVYKHMPVLANLNAVWRRLVGDGKSIRVFCSEEGGQDQRSRELIDSGSLAAVFEEESLEKRLVKLFRERSTLEQLTGDSAFFLALGFLEWRDAPEGKTHFAPLLLLHVEILRSKTAGGGVRTYSVQMDTGEHSGNPCLREKLNQEQQLDLPPAEAITSPEDYLKAVEAAVAKKSQWRVHRTAALGFFNFTRYRLWLDLDPSEWPEGESPEEHPLVRDLIEQEWTGENQAMPDDREIAEHQIENDLPIVLDADSTQYAAMLAAVRGQSMVVIGPPGSGKSQTITNLIAATIAEGKRVLFVAQKVPALEVVQRRLTDVGLSAFCLSLHTQQSKPSDVHRQLRLAGSARASNGGPHTGRNGISQMARSLNAVAETLRMVPPGLSSSIAELIQRGCVLRAQAKEAWGGGWDDRLLELEIPDGDLTDAWHDERTRCLSEWSRFRIEAQEHWKGWKPVTLTPPDATRLEDQLRKLQSAIKTARDGVEPLPPTLKQMTIRDLAESLSRVVRTKLPESQVQGLLEYAWRSADRDTRELHELERLLEDYWRQRERAMSTLREPDKSPVELAKAVATATASVAEWVRPTMQLNAAELLLKDLASAIGKIDDLLAESARFPDGVGLLAGQSAISEPTWKCVEGFAALRVSPEVENRPILHTALARALAQGRTNQQEVRELLRKIKRVRETEATAEESLPGIKFSTPQDRQRWLEANAKLLAQGIGHLMVGSAEALRLAVKRLHSISDELTAAHEQVGGTVSRLLPQLTNAACRELADRMGSWNTELLTPADEVPDKLLGVLTEALSSETVSLASLLSSAQTMESARSLDQQLSKEFSSHSPRSGPVDLPPTLTTIAAEYCKAGGISVMTADLMQLRRTGDQISRFIEQNTPFLASIARAFELPIPETLADIKHVAVLSTLLTKMPPLPSNGILNQVSKLADVSRLRRAVNDVEGLAAQRQTLSASYRSTSLPPYNQAASLRQKLEAKQGKLFKWISTDYRGAKRAAYELLTPPTPADGLLIRHLAEVEAHLTSSEQLAADANLTQLTKGVFKGLSTDWTGTIPVLDWAEAFFKLIAGKPPSLSRLAALKAKANTKLEAPARLFDQLAKALADLSERYGWAFIGERAVALLEIREKRIRLNDLREMLNLIVAEASSVVGDMEKLGCHSGLSLGELADAVKQNTELSQAIESLRSLQPILTAPILHIDPSHVRLVADWYERNRQNRFPAADLIWIAGHRRDAVRSLQVSGQLIVDWVSAFKQAGEAMPDSRWDGSGTPAATGERAERFIEELDGLTNDLPDAKAPSLTFKALNDLLTQLQSCDTERDATSSWDELLGEQTFETDLELLIHTSTWMKQATAGVPNGVLDWCLEAETDARLHWLKAMAGNSTHLRQSIDRVTKAGIIKREELGSAVGLPDSRQIFSLRRAMVGASVELLVGVASDTNTTFEAMSQAGAALSRSCTLADKLALWDVEIGVKASELRAAQVADHRRWAVASRSSAIDLVQWVLVDDTAVRYLKLTEGLGAVEAVALAHRTLLAVMRNSGELESNGPAKIADEGMSIDELEASVARLQTSLPRLLPWADCLREQFRADKLRMSALMTVAAVAYPPPSFEQLNIALKAAVAVRQATCAWESEKQLTNFRGHSHDRLRREFAEADASLLERNQIRVADQVLGHTRGLPFDEGRTATAQMYNLLRHEEQKLKKHISVRELVKRAGPALQEYCPCWLMTPMAVAQFLPPGKIDFDVVIMDEASQLAPEDAWGAIARGAQLIVVGDPKQMPPTDFFSTSVGEDEEEKSEDEPLSGAKLDSILDTASNCLPQSWLQWHYRSRHQSLIAPANRFSYGDKLILFPSSHDRHPALGIRHTFIPNAVATTGRVVNTKEAAAVVDRLIQIAREEVVKPAAKRLSVGIVAMNMAQQECIQDMLDTRVAADAGIEQAVACLYENGNEPLIIRNLENIQGDERDIILISYTYGPNTAGGTPAQRFGPLIFEGGERRFNVLITRSKSRMEVFSSMRSDQILVTGKKAGVQHFHYFLKFAESGTLMDPGGVTQRTPDSPFEEHVMAVLKADGYQVEPQVGVAGYFVDLAVRDPRDPARFILGIECDGATYHSSRAARDRDRLREQVLRDRGWRLYRVWSTDWFTNYEAAKESLLVSVARTCEGML